MPDKSNLRKWISDDSRFRFKISNSLLSSIVKKCSDSEESETGGVLVGYYSEDLTTAVVTDISDAPSDSTFGTTWFRRGVAKLQSWLDTIWEETKHFYLGEWHYHPHSAPIASGKDNRQMQEFSESKQLNCPEPLLLIIGGDPKGEWSTAVYVFPRGQAPKQLLEEKDIPIKES